MKAATLSDAESGGESAATPTLPEKIIIRQIIISMIQDMTWIQYLSVPVLQQIPNL